MADVAIVTDSNSGISVEEGRAMGVTVIPMPVHINGRIFYEGLDITQKEFYDRLIEGADVATSQPRRVICWMCGIACWGSTGRLSTSPCPQG